MNRQSEGEELSYVLRSVESVRVNVGGHGLPLERDLYYSTSEPLSVHNEPGGS
jgi:hypothetical protein